MGSALSLSSMYSRTQFEAIGFGVNKLSLDPRTQQTDIDKIEAALKKRLGHLAMQASSGLPGNPSSVASKAGSAKAPRGEACSSYSEAGSSMSLAVSKAPSRDDLFSKDGVVCVPRRLLVEGSMRLEAGLVC